MPSVPGAAPSLLTVGAPSGVPGLSAFLDMMADQAGPVVGEQSALPERQNDAEPGKSLPDEDQDLSTDDPALAWLMAGMQSATPQPTPVALPKFQLAAPRIATATSQDVAAPLIAPPIAGTDATLATPTGNPDTATANGRDIAPQAAPQPVTLGVNLIAPLPAGIPTDLPAIPAAAPAAPATQPDVVSTKPRAPALVAIDPTRLPTPLVSALNNDRNAVTPLAIASTARTAAALPAMFALAAQRHEDRDSDSIASPAIAGAALLQPTDAAKLIAQPGEMQRQTLDMGRQDWPQKMIDRIETLRDNADANDTSIRLKPEALGQIDVSIRSHADGAISVKFTAEQPAARALIADAQPQLAAAAEARGIRLSGTSVDLAGSGQGGGDRSRQPAESNRNTSNRLASGGDDITADSGGRIA